MGKLWALFDVFRKGSSVSDPKLWKNGGGAVIAVTSLLLALSKAARSFGYDLPLSEGDAGAIATGIVTAVGLFITFATSSKVGLPAKPKVPSDGFPPLEPDARKPIDWKSVADRDFNAERGS